MHAVETSYQSLLLPGIFFSEASSYTLVVRTCLRTQHRNARQNIENSCATAVKSCCETWAISNTREYEFVSTSVNVTACLILAMYSQCYHPVFCTMELRPKLMHMPVAIVHHVLLSTVIRKCMCWKEIPVHSGFRAALIMSVHTVSVRSADTFTYVQVRVTADVELCRA